MATRAAEKRYSQGQELAEAVIRDRGMIATEALALEDEAMGREEIVLSLHDLLQDEQGEIVLYNDSNLRSIAIVTDVAKLEEGVSGRHLTQAGENVTGFRFVRFANGMTVFHQDSVNLDIRPNAA